MTRSEDKKPNGSSIRLVQLPFYSKVLQYAIDKAITESKKTILQKSGIVVRKLSKNEIILLLEHEELEELTSDNEEKAKIKNIYVLNSRHDAVIKLNHFLYEKHYMEYL